MKRDQLPSKVFHTGRQSTANTQTHTWSQIAPHTQTRNGHTTHTARHTHDVGPHLDCNRRLKSLQCSDANRSSPSRTAPSFSEYFVGLDEVFASPSPFLRTATLSRILDSALPGMMRLPKNAGGGGACFRLPVAGAVL